jgi:hypothetical protein
MLGTAACFGGHSSIVLGHRDAFRSSARSSPPRRADRLGVQVGKVHMLMLCRPDTTEGCNHIMAVMNTFKFTSFASARMLGVF